MAQYCRYCSNLVVGDIAYCQIRKKEIREALAKTTNYCRRLISTRLMHLGKMRTGTNQERNAWEMSS